MATARTSPASSAATAPTPAARARAPVSRQASTSIALKVLDAEGQGQISDVIAALDYVVAHRDELNIRIVNLSVGAGMYEAYDTGSVDARRRARRVQGRHRRRRRGRELWPRPAGSNHVQSGITAPGNLPGC